MVQVGIELKQVRSTSSIPSFATGVYESHPATVKVGCKVNLDVICVIPSKSKEPSKLLKCDLIPPSLGHPMKLTHVPPLFNIQGGIELGNYLTVLILLKRHDIPQVFGSTSSHYLIKDCIMLCLHIGPVNPLRNCRGLSLSNDHGLIEVLLKCRVKSIVNARFFFNKPWIFSSFPPPNLFCPCS
jgi:hypothetical protein